MQTNVDGVSLWFMIFAVDGLRYVMGTSLVTLMVFWLVRHRGYSRLQAGPVTSAQIRRELTYSFATVAVYASIGMGVVALHRQGFLQIYEDTAQFGWLWTLAGFPLLMVLHDAYFYWMHRFVHKPAIFRRVHRIHHLSVAPTPLAAYAFAPAEAALMALFVPLVTLWLPVHEGVLFFYLGFMILRNAIGHCGVEFHPRWWVRSPLDCLTTVVHHDLHHQGGHGNYGLYFTWWDRWQGTEIPGYRERFVQAASQSATTAMGSQRYE